MTTIRKLDARTAEQIAAGEVVENPSSLVKELVENSLDARARRVRILLRQGGLKEITVIDDGRGILPQEVRLALERHATSKITCTDDLGKINTLGFRGEALPSIAAVSKLSITTRHCTEESGIQAYFEGGREKAFQETGFITGTKVTVQDLFFNTPARLKFLKSIPAETARVSRTVHRLALSRPDVSFALYREKKLLLETPGDGRLLNAIVKIYGSAFARELLALDFNAETLTLHGYVSSPSFSYRSRNRQLFFVNQRCVQSPLFRETLDRSYARIVTAKRFPAAFLFLALSPEKIDVNVHPSKIEVRFQHEEKVRQFLEQGLHTIFKPRSSIFPTQTKIPPHRANERIKEQAALFFPSRPQKESFAVSEAQTASGNNNTDPDNGSIKASDDHKIILPETGSFSLQAHTIDDNIFNGTILGQVFATYLVLADGDNLVLVDQHAAHERILWEKILLLEKNKDRYIQEIIPVTMELPPLAAEEFREKIELLKGLGLEIELFGHNTFIVRAVPFYLKDVFSAEMCRDIFEELSREALLEKEYLKETLLQLACKTAIKAHQVLTPEEMKTLLNNLKKCADPFFCPHGRPVVIKITKTELEKLFKRRG